MHIAMVSETTLPDVNGVAMTLGQMVSGLRARGHQLHMIRPRRNKDDVADLRDGYSETLVNGFPLPGYPGLRAGLPSKSTLLRLWSKQRPDVVHIATEGPLGWTALSAARQLGLPVSSYFHTNFQSYTSHYHLRLLRKPVSAYLRHFHNKANRTLVPTVAMQRELERQGYSNVGVISRGVDAELFNPNKRDDALRASWDADAHTPVVMLVSRLAAEKNLDVACLAYREIQKLHPEARMVIVGDGPARKDLQLRYPDVIFTGVKTGNELAQYYASGDIFLYPSLTETYGNVTIEAMASGLAVVAYDYAAAQLHIKHDVNGLLVPYADNAAFIGQAQALASDMARVQRLRSAAPATVSALSWSQIIGQLEAVLSDIVCTQGVQYVQPKIATATD